MLETTNPVLNGSLYNFSTPNALLAWHRVRLANWLASGGKQWAAYLSEYNSGKDEGVTLCKGVTLPLQGHTITSTWFWT